MRVVPCNAGTAGNITTTALSPARNLCNVVVVVVVISRVKALLFRSHVSTVAI